MSKEETKVVSEKAFKEAMSGTVGAFDALMAYNEAQDLQIISLMKRCTVLTFATIVMAVVLVVITL